MNQEAISAIKSKLQENIRQVVFVCGLGGAGKSEFCSNIQAALGREAFIVRNDWYLIYSSSERRNRIEQALDSNNADRIEQEANPQNWYDWDKLAVDLEALRSLGSLQLVNVWNQQTGEKDLSVDVRVGSDAVIICDGIYLLDPEVQTLSDVTVLLEVSPKVARQRAEKRDEHRSESAYLQLKDSLMQRYDIPYFEKHRDAADIIINNDNFDEPSLVKS